MHKSMFMDEVPLTRSLEVPNLFNPSRGRRSAESLCVNWVACFSLLCWCMMALSLISNSFFPSLMISGKVKHTNAS